MEQLGYSLKSRLFYQQDKYELIERQYDLLN